MQQTVDHVLLAARFARRELRGGLAGFRIFLACLILGVAAIAGVGSMSAAFLQGLAEEGRSILGGDLDLRLTHRAATDEERAWLDANTAAVSEAAEMRAMTRSAAAESGARTLVELKAVDNAYPLQGAMALTPDIQLADALAKTEDRWGAVVEPNLLTRLNVQVGDILKLGEAEITIRAIIDDEPDRMAGGMAIGPRLMIAREALDDTGLFTLGSLIRFHYRTLLTPDGVPDEDLKLWKDQLETALPDAGWRVQDRTNGAPGVRRFVVQVTLFLTLVGLTSLVVGGVGVGNGVKSYLDTKRKVIATFKCLGAPGGLIFTTYLLQVLAIAVIGILFGLLIGAVVPFLVNSFFGYLFPVPARTQLYLAPLILAAIFGILAALAFTIWPLARAREIPATGLFRDIVAPTRRWPRLPYGLGLGTTFVALTVLAVATSAYPEFAAWFVVGAAATFGLLMGTGWGLVRLSKTLPPVTHPGLRLALANLHRPGAPTVSVVLSMGLGLTLLVTITQIDGNIQRQVSNEIPEKAPSFFFVDIQRDQSDPFEKMVQAHETVTQFEKVPALRGQIKLLNGKPADPEAVAPDARWALRGDRGVSYSAEPPNEGSEIVAGDWWPADYQGPPLISFARDLAEGMGLAIGDTMTVRILGRDIMGTIANLRDIDFSTAGINFTIIFSPGAFAGAPHTFLATATASPEKEESLQRKVTDAFSNITVVSIREAIEAINGILQNLVLAVRGTSLITLLAGVLVLAGAMAAGHRHRVYDAVVLKVLGATRGRILESYVMEYAILGLTTAVVAGAIGTLAAYLVITQVMEGTWTFLPGLMVATALGATLLTIVLGLSSTWQVLSQKATPILRSE